MMVATLELVTKGHIVNPINICYKHIKETFIKSDSGYIFHTVESRLLGSQGTMKVGSSQACRFFRATQQCCPAGS